MIPDNINSTTKITYHYPKLSVYGASLQGRALDGVVSFEAGHYDSRQDRSGTRLYYSEFSDKISHRLSKTTQGGLHNRASIL